MENGQSWKTTYMTKVKGSERRQFIIQYCPVQADKIVMEIKEWKQKVPDGYVNIFSIVLLSVLETSIVS